MTIITYLNQNRHIYDRFVYSVFCHIERIGLDLVPRRNESLFLAIENDCRKFVAQEQAHSLIEAVSAGLKEHDAVAQADLFGETSAQKIVHRA